MFFCVSRALSSFAFWFSLLLSNPNFVLFWFISLCFFFIIAFSVFIFLSIACISLCFVAKSFVF